MAHGTENLGQQTSSTKLIVDAMLRLYDRIVDPILLVRRITVAAARVIPESDAAGSDELYEQLDLFTDYEALEKERAARKEQEDRDKRVQKAVLEIRKRFGNNAVVRGMNLEEGATAISRNSQIGGHNA